ncbi:MAG: formate--tetrahydrofolate ligase [Alphaproteobacteria bacterium]|nr:formate--tetrahydrofolate ligase [Alphaproteobacteria bacterium]
MKSDLEIAQAAPKLPIKDIAKTIGFSEQDIIPFGHDKAKISFSALNALPQRLGKLILVTAISPTPAGEGKTTTSIGLADALNDNGYQTTLCLREASLGPCFGAKGGATGGGHAQIVPMEDINLHFTGDLHAITSAHNLLSAMIDNHLYWGNEQQIDPRRVSWRRTMDVNDRSLRDMISALGGSANGYTQQTGFDITAASEIMAIVCLAKDLQDLKNMLGNIIIGQRFDRSTVTCKDIGAVGPMSALLAQAMQPNLVQTLEHNPALVHGGPFANIAHGCNSVMATLTGLKASEFVVTEAGFGADLGAEKFLNIKCRKTGLVPQVVVLVATVRALKMHGGVPLTELTQENTDAVIRGCANLGRHIKNLQSFGLNIVVAINHFVKDTDAELSAISQYVESHGCQAILARHWEQGSAGAKELAMTVANIAQNSDTPSLHFTYEDDQSLLSKIESIAKKLYAARGIQTSNKVRQQLASWEKEGYGHLPVCIAKTQYSFSTDPLARGAPTDHILEVREVRLSAGAGFIVAICGDVMTMPGLPRIPAALSIDTDKEGKIVGLS